MLRPLRELRKRGQAEQWSEPDLARMERALLRVMGETYASAHGPDSAIIGVFANGPELMRVLRINNSVLVEHLEAKGRYRARLESFVPEREEWVTRAVYATEAEALRCARALAPPLATVDGLERKWGRLLAGASNRHQEPLWAEVFDTEDKAYEFWADLCDVEAHSPGAMGLFGSSALLAQGIVEGPALNTPARADRARLVRSAKFLDHAEVLLRQQWEGRVAPAVVRAPSVEPAW
jgi:hypothetical protein